MTQTKLWLFNFAIIIVFVTQLISCATVAKPHGGLAPVDDADVFLSTPQEELGLKLNTTNQATIALLKNAQQQAGAGKLEAAVATLERALRIEPRNPLLWHNLAAIRLEQGQHRQAAALAAKSTSLTSENPDLIADNHRIIERANIK